MFYSRCVYGRGIVPSIANFGPMGSRMVIKSIRDGFIATESKPLRHQLN